MEASIEFVMNTPRITGFTTAPTRIISTATTVASSSSGDRIFSTFEAEDEKVRFGLTKNINTFNPLRVATHEFTAIGRDVWHAERWRDRWGYVAKVRAGSRSR